MPTVLSVQKTGNETITLDDTAEEEEETERRRREESSSPCSVIEIIGPPTTAHSRRRQQESNIQDIASRYCPPVACPDYIPLRTGYTSGLPVSSNCNRGRAAYADVAARGKRGRTLAPRRGLATDGRGATKGRGGRPTPRRNGLGGVPPPWFSASRGLNLQFGGGVPPPPPGEVFRFTGSNQTAAAANTRQTIDATVFSGRDQGDA
jgi:hypothetical protein